MKKKLQHHLYLTEYGNYNSSTYTWEVGYSVFPHKFSSPSSGHAYIGPVEIEVDIPDDFNPTVAKLAVLEEREAQLRSEFERQLSDIIGERMNLLALEAPR